VDGLGEEEIRRVSSGERWFAAISGLVFLAVLVYIAERVPYPTEWQEFLFRIILALAGAAFAAMIAGFLHIEGRFQRTILRAGGGLAVFALIYLVNPPKLVSHNAHNNFNLLVSKLSYIEHPERLIKSGLVSDSDAQKLNEFIRGYLKERAPEELNRKLVRNAAYIVYRKSDALDAAKLYEAIIAKIPDDPRILEHYAFALVTVDPRRAKEKLEMLIKEYPGQHEFVFTHAVAALALDEFDVAAADFHHCLDKRLQATTYEKWIKILLGKKPDVGKEVWEKYEKLRNSGEVPAQQEK